MTLGIYRHYTGNLYVVTGFAWNSNNDQAREEMVIYVSLKYGTTNVRSREQFTETVELAEGAVVPRFVYIGQADPEAK